MTARGARKSVRAPVRATRSANAGPAKRAKPTNSAPAGTRAGTRATRRRPAKTARLPKTSSAAPRKRAAKPLQQITFFATPAAWRAWLLAFHASETEFWVGFHKRHTATPSISWPEAVDGALAFGWIDGVRKRIDDLTYMIRFTPRKATSIWSAVNVRRLEALRADGLMHPAGEAAFAARSTARTGVYSYERRPADLPEPFLGRLKENQTAFRFFSAQAPWYRRTATWWVISAKKGETREKRFAQLVEDCASGRRIKPLRPTTA